MNTISASQNGVFCRLKLLFALSRTPHGLIDMATPFLAALLALGALPPLEVLVIGLVTAFAGYTAVYALNDVIDFPVDKKKVRQGGFGESTDYLDGVMMRHPLARGALSYRSGVLWVLAWAVLATIGAYLLNPVCVLIFIGGCILETVYCLMWKVSYIRTIISGVVKTCGGVAAVFAVKSDPGLPFLFILFFWLFFWEIGGQNIPHDLTDLHEDKRAGASTIPVRWGLQLAVVIVLGCLIVTILLNVALLKLSQSSFDTATLVGAQVIGLFLLIIPAWRLFRSQKRLDAIGLFNKASYYPLALLGLVIVRLAF